ncbi:MAG TPA: HupE/UreJ family protein [Stellaceae bacterium]|nr:HupE/UreJ family protein [Stellaceae bacterium]
MGGESNERRGALQPALLLLVLMIAAKPALAHVTAANMAGGFATGFLHPLTGPDHLLAMVSVGIWGAQLGAPAIWVLPIAFPLIMAVGGALGVIGVPLPATELLIALSVLVLGLMVAQAKRLPLAVALAIIAVFAIAHGHAHGAELPHSTDAVSFCVGFVMATGLLHALGITIGLLIRWPQGALAIRGLGSLVATIGVYFVYVYAAV